MRNEFNDVLDIDYFNNHNRWKPLLVSGNWYDKLMCHILYCRMIDSYSLGYTIYLKYSLESHILSISQDDDINSGIHFNVSTLRELEDYTRLNFIKHLFSDE
jgi:hypothetical protein